MPFIHRTVAAFPFTSALWDLLESLRTEAGLRIDDNG